MRLRLIICLLLAGLLSACASSPAPTAVPQTATVAVTATMPPTATALPPTATPLPTATSSPTPQITRLRADAACQQALEAVGGVLPAQLLIAGQPWQVSVVADGPAEITLAVMAAQKAHDALAVRYLTAVAPFRSLRDEITSAEIKTAWSDGQGLALIVDPQVAAALEAAWGAPHGTVALAAVTAEQLAAAEAVGLLGFEQLDPTLKALRVDGQDVLSNQFDPAAYPLGLALVAEADAAVLEQLAPLAASWANRDAEQLTQLVMTGVTAMCRLTAERMEEHGYTYPAAVVGPTLRQADITHISNEVPFIAGCPVEVGSDSLVFCSDYGYWEALAAVGADIVGLSGNHVNDHGYAGAAESLAYYASLGVPVYGSGLNVDAACQPLMWEDHGNTFAFVGALAFDPQYAWATADQPGACYYYDNKERILNLVRALDKQVDVVSVELQYYETYHPFPTAQQVVEFRELRAAGADLVTGVQSHVPQAWEPYGADAAGGPGMILYGLGNLFFDQMWSWETRTGLIARHTIYDGRLLNTEILTTVLEDYAQPRWATPKERLEILERVHDAAPEADTLLYLDRPGSAVYATELALHAWLAGEHSTAAYWGLSALTDAAFAPEARGGRVTATDWRVVDVQESAEDLQVIVEFSETTCQLDGATYTYPEAHLAAFRVTVEGDVVQIRASNPWEA